MHTVYTMASTLRTVLQSGPIVAEFEWSEGLFLPCKVWLTRMTPRGTLWPSERTGNGVFVSALFKGGWWVKIDDENRDRLSTSDEELLAAVGLARLCK